MSPRQSIVKHKTDLGGFCLQLENFQRVGRRVFALASDLQYIHARNERACERERQRARLDIAAHGAAGHDIGPIQQARVHRVDLARSSATQNFADGR